MEAGKRTNTGARASNKSTEAGQHVSQHHFKFAPGVRAIIQIAEGMLANINESDPLSSLDQHIPVNLKKTLRSYEIDLIIRALVVANGSQTKAARLLGISDTTLHSKIKRFGL
jgi:transcriptional regulator with GAF, ATPase, and Fis domain